MRRLRLIAALAVLIATTALGAEADELMPAQPADCVPDEILVKFRPGADPAVVSTRHGATIRSVIGFIDVYVLAIPFGSVPEKVAEFSADPEVEYAEPNGIARAVGGPSAGACGP